MSETTAPPPPSSASPLGEPRCWKISPGQGGQYWDQFRTRKFIAIGWDEIGDVREWKPTSGDELLRHLLLERFKNSELSRRHAATQIWMFYGLMKPGDFVCAYGKGKVLGWGKIVGPYEHTTDDLRYAHRRAVEWKSLQPTSVGGVSSALNQKLRRQKTIIELTTIEFAELQNPPSRPPTPPAAKTIDQLSGTFNGVGLHFTPWQIATFFTALQTKGFVILSGISGTGKTKLVQHFASVLPQPARIAVPNKEQIVLSVNPSTLKWGNFVIPMRARQLCGLLDLETNRDIVVRYDGQKFTSRLNKSSGDKAISLLTQVAQLSISWAAVGQTPNSLVIAFQKSVKMSHNPLIYK